MLYHSFFVGIFITHSVAFFSLFLKKRKWYYLVLFFGFLFPIAYNINQILDLQAEITNAWVAVCWAGITICTLSGIFLLRDQKKVLKVKLMRNPKTRALFLQIILAYVKFKDKIRRIFSAADGYSASGGSGGKNEMLEAVLLPLI